MASVLLVDDEVIVRVAVRRMLESAGIEVAEAVDGAEAMRIFRNRQADVVLCDLFMPGKDGLQLTQELRREFPSIPMIAMSGGLLNGAVDMLPVALQLGAAKVLNKPFTQAEAMCS